MIRYFRFSYNFVMGPFPSNTEGRRDEVAAAAAAASRGLGERPEAASIGMVFGQHLHIFFAGIFLGSLLALLPHFSGYASQYLDWLDFSCDQAQTF